MVDYPVPTYQTTNYKKEDGKTMLLISLAVLTAIVILFGAAYFMFLAPSSTGQLQQKLAEKTNIEDLNQSGTNAQNDEEESNNNSIQTTPTATPTPQNTTTPSPTPTLTNTPTPEQENSNYDSSYIYGTTQTMDYKIAADQASIVDKTNKTIYTAPSGYKIISFALNGNSLFVVFKTPEAYTFEFRKVPKATSSLGGLFYKYVSAYDMVSFVVNPNNYKDNPTYIIFQSIIKKQILVLKIVNFQEKDKQIINVSDYTKFLEAHKVKGQDAINISYKASDGSSKDVLVNFE